MGYDPIHMNYCGSLNQKVNTPFLRYPIYLPEVKSIKRQHPEMERTLATVHG